MHLNGQKEGILLWGMKPISRDFDGVSHKNIAAVQGVRSDQTTEKVE